MSVKIRLSKVGKKHQVAFRIVATDTRTKRDGKFLEILGYYNPYNKPAIRFNQEKINSWIAKGATMSPAVAKLIQQSKTDVSESSADHNLTT